MTKKLATLLTSMFSLLFASSTYALPLNEYWQLDGPASLQSCYEQFTKDHGEALRNHIRRILTTSIKVLKLEGLEAPRISQATYNSCSDIFQNLHSSVLINSAKTGTPNLFPSYYYDFLMDGKTVKTMKRLLRASAPIPLAVNFNDDQAKGFIFNMAHYLVMEQSSTLTPFCQQSFIHQESGQFGCRAVVAKFFLEGLKSNIGKQVIFTWHPSTSSLEELKIWLQGYTTQDYVLGPVVAVYQTIALNETLHTGYLGGLVGIPDLEENTFDPLKPVDDSKAPLLKASESFKTSCETFDPEKLGEVYCNSIELKPCLGCDESVVPANAFITLEGAKVSGVNFEASLGPVTLDYSYSNQPAEIIVSASETFPAIAVLGTGPYPGNPLSSLLINSKFNISYRPEVKRTLGSFSNEGNPIPAPKYDRDVYVFGLYNWVDEYLITQNSITLERCDLMTVLHNDASQKTSPQIVAGNNVKNAQGVPCKTIVQHPILRLMTIIMRHKHQL
ncbi:MAG: hypothetical protein ACR2PT_03585 [Endozoicomonas sp.]